MSTITAKRRKEIKEHLNNIADGSESIMPRRTLIDGGTMRLMRDAAAAIDALENQSTQGRGPWHGVCGLAEELTARAKKAEAEVERLTKHCSALEVEVAVLSEGLSEDHAIYIANARAKKAEAEVENLKTDLFLALRQINIPAGFWGRAASRYKARAEKMEASLHDLTLDLSTANHMIKLERDRADALQTRLNELDSILKKHNLID